jgi:60 kDa SS-A/Ro ribonucleoprotein
MKYSNRNGFTQRDILRLAKPIPANSAQATLFSWITKPDNIPDVRDDVTSRAILDVSEALYKYAVAKSLSNFGVDQIVSYILKYRLPHEVIPTEHLKDVRIWQALFDAKMPINALIRNLGKMTSLNMFAPLSDNLNKVISTLTNTEHIQKARLHPINIYNQLKGYSTGMGMSGLTWVPVKQIRDALQSTFYSAFKTIEPTNKPTLIAIDVSGSMNWQAIDGMNLTCSEVAAIMAMATAKVESNYHIVGFCDSLKDLGISGSTNIEEAVRRVQHNTFGGTDCALPMVYAKHNKLNVDNFLVYTDNETWAGSIEPYVALRQYRQASGKDSNLVVVAGTSTGFSIADPDDAGMLDIAGFSSAVPQVISYFCSKKK